VLVRWSRRYLEGGWEEEVIAIVAHQWVIN
jgi:hypothetical protein